jgi:hypothetical protein
LKAIAAEGHKKKATKAAVARKGKNGAKPDRCVCLIWESSLAEEPSRFV